jgi:hypothetical protein
MFKITWFVKPLTGDTIRDDENTNWLVAERGILDPWDVNIQDLPQFVAGGCLTCGGVSNEIAKSRTQ